MLLPVVIVRIGIGWRWRATIAQQPLDTALQIALVDDALNAEDHRAIAIDQRGRGQFHAEPKSLHIGGGGALPYWEIDPQTVHKFRDARACGFVVGGGTGDVDTTGRVSPMQRYQDRHLLDARRAPGRPEVEQHDAAAMPGEARFNVLIGGGSEASDEEQTV